MPALTPGEIGFGTPWADQIAILRDKLDLPTEAWDDVQAAAHDRAFVVAGAQKADLLADLHSAVVEQASNGKGIKDFTSEFKAVVARTGWTGWTGEGTAAGTAWRAGVIYQTNMATSYAAGRYRQLTDPALLALRPYWRYHHADGVLHPRPLHLAWDGITLPAMSPFFQTHFAPNGWGCHCYITAEKAPAADAKTAPPAGWDRRDPTTGTLPGIDKGWDYTPGATARDTPLQEFVAAKLITYPPAIAAAVEHDFTAYLSGAGRPAAWAEKVLQGALSGAAPADALWLGFADSPFPASAASAAAADVRLADGVRTYTVTLPAETVRQLGAAAPAAGTRAPTPADYAEIAAMLGSDAAVQTGADGLVTATRQVGAETWTAQFRVVGKALALVALAIGV